MTFDSTVRLTRVEAPREVALEREWTGMIRPNGRYMYQVRARRFTCSPRPRGSPRRGLGPSRRILNLLSGSRMTNKHWLHGNDHRRHLGVRWHGPRPRLPLTSVCTTLANAVVF